ncbi:sodium:solute symporter family protein [Virgibacillus halodenitrificans]|uniref:sodium:solute symporter family protein n=1 Tax=Virgibacillus halodenitrificans TaxID=1482 RepID=UPI0024C03420|nr:sodium:solute symporter family protein [Virgibacillus halodenitrificans]WHX26208.1 sodium:solute symporter family protein [Virgibacillus halodenitrificans]
MILEQSLKLALIIIVLVYVLLILGVAYYFYRKTKTYDQYNMGGRSMPMIPMILTTVGLGIGGSTLLGYMSDAYALGYGRVWLTMSTTIVFVIFTAFFVKPVRKLGDKHKFFTIGDYAAYRYGKAARLPTFIGNLFAIGALTGLQFVALATILNLLFDVNIVTGIIIAAVFLTIKTYLGGLTAVIWTDAIQGTIQTVGISLLFFVIYFQSGGFGEVAENIQQIPSVDTHYLKIFNIPLSSILIPLLTMGAAVLVRQDTWQRVWASKDINVARNSNWWAALIMALTGAIIIIVGVFARGGLGIETDQPALVYYHVIFEYLPVALGLILFVTLVATILSSADSFFIAGSTMLVTDMVKPFIKNPTGDKMLRYSRLMVLVMGAFGLFLALTIPRLIELWITGSAILAAGILIPIVMGMFWERPSNLAGVTSMWVGILVAVFWQIAGHPFDIHPVFIGMPMCFIVFMIMTFTTFEDKSSIDNEKIAR